MDEPYYLHICCACGHTESVHLAAGNAEEPLASPARRCWGRLHRMVRIGGGQGFYGDGYAGVGPLLEEGVDYLVCEALAELTLAILAKDRPPTPKPPEKKADPK